MSRKAENTVAANDLAIAKVAKTDVEAQREWKVLGVPGLSLVKKPSGIATYYVRHMAGQGARRKQVRVAIGLARDDDQSGRRAIKLSQAKATAIELAANGAANLGDDGTPKTTLRELFAEFEANDKRRSPRTMSDYRDALDRDLFKRKRGEPTPLGDVPLAEITAKDIAKALTKIQTRSRNAAHKTRAALGSLYKWAAERMLVEKNLMSGMGFTHKNEPRERVPSDDEIGKLWRVIESDEFGAMPAMRLILKLAILTGQRNSEVAGARTSELHIGPTIANPYWHIPKTRMKRKGRDQLVFLSSQARALFSEALELAGDSEFVFPASTFGRHVEGVEREHITQESVSKAMARAVRLAKLKNLHLHDMRKAITKWLGDRGERADILDRILHHHSGHHSNQRSSVTETHYNFSVMAEPLRKAWQAWADHVEQVAGSSSKSDAAAKVTRLHSRNA